MSIKQMLGGRYQLVACLRSSDRETVYLAKDRQGRQSLDCIVRRFRLTEHSQRTSRFTALRLKKKAQALHQLSTCRYLPTVLACFEEANSVYVVEEFIPGAPLSEIIGSGQPLATDMVVDLMREILQGLVAIHRWGFVHGQIRPANIVRCPADGTLILTGFGGFDAIVADGQGSSHLEPTSLEDRLYMVPDEQRWTRFSQDIYAVGILSIQGLSGLTARELSRRLRTSENLNRQQYTIPMWQTCVTLTPQLVTVLQRMTHPDIEYRYQTAIEVLDDLHVAGKDKTDRSHSRNLLYSPPQSVEASHHWQQRIPWKRIGLWGAGITICAGLLGLAFNRLPQRLLSRYLLHYAHKTAQQGDLKTAIALSTRALNYAGHGKAAYLQRGLTHYQLKDWAAAQADFTRAIAIDKRGGKAFYYRGLSRDHLGDQQGALLDYTQALALGAHRVQAYLRRGHIRASVGDAQGAILDYTLAIQEQPNLAIAYSRRCLAYLDIAQPESALQDCSQAINLNPGGITAYQNRSLVRQRLGDIGGAIADLTI
ncbi:MAG: protein kinase family protein, partial [Elainellaceae cyanobacterium]